MKPKPEENNMKKEYPRPKEGIFISKRKLIRHAPHEYPTAEETFDNGLDDDNDQN